VFYKLHADLNKKFNILLIQLHINIIDFNEFCFVVEFQSFSAYIMHTT
jgi:hypothetical protein